MKITYLTTSRKKTPWDTKDNLTSLEDFIKSKYKENYDLKHPKLCETKESK